MITIVVNACCASVLCSIAVRHWETCQTAPQRRRRQTSPGLEQGETRLAPQLVFSSASHAARRARGPPSYRETARSCGWQSLPREGTAHRFPRPSAALPRLRGARQRPRRRQATAREKTAHLASPFAFPSPPQRPAAWIGAESAMAYTGPRSPRQPSRLRSRRPSLGARRRAPVSALGSCPSFCSSRCFPALHPASLWLL